MTDSTIDCDIAIIGAGAAGLAACVEAGESGLTTICIESQDSTGGNERFVEGCFAQGSSMQKEEGLEYSTGSLIKQELEQAQYRVSGIMYNEMVHRSGENLDWLLDHGVQFMLSAHADSLIIAAGGAPNRNFNVVDTAGNPIPGLYAVGVEGAMLWANVYTINISGACNASSVNSGRTAVRHAAANRP